MATAKSNGIQLNLSNDESLELFNALINIVDSEDSVLADIANVLEEFVGN